MPQTPGYGVGILHMHACVLAHYESIAIHIPAGPTSTMMTDQLAVPPPPLFKSLDPPLGVI